MQAVAHLHEHNICHRDIKPANILLGHTSQTTYTASPPHNTHSTPPYKLILCDFGASEKFNPHTNPAGFVSHTAGSPADWAPEAVFPEKYDTDVGLDLASETPEIVTQCGSKTAETEDMISQKVHRFSAYGLDMWALGVLLFEMFYLRHPFYRAELSELELFARIDSHDPLLGVTNYMCMIDFADSTVNCLDRHSATTIVQPPNAECVRLLEGLLQKEPTMRWSVDTLLDFDVFT
jgi:serine/threonine protein kinase